ncbi:MAG: hypothetical protein KC431_25055 [Myxococcales bacterium]|nr:hypothetical protein [Myxococcales bacterium]
MPNNPLGNRRRQQNRRRQNQAGASPRRRVALDNQALPRDLSTFVRRGLGLQRNDPNPQLVDPVSIEYGNSSVYHWGQAGDPPTRRRALWASIGDADADIDATLAELTNRGGDNPTTLSLGLEPTLDDSPASIMRVVQAIDQHNQGAPANQQIEIQTNSGYVRALRDGWISVQNLTALENDIGRVAADQLMHEAIATDHPSRIGAMLANLRNPAVNVIDMPENNTVVVGDSLRVWSRVDRALGAMLTPEPGTDPNHLDPPNGTFPGRDAAWLRDQVRAMMPAAAAGGLLQFRQLIEDVANYNRGIREPLLRRLNDAYRDPPLVMARLVNEPLDTAHLPGGSSLRQAIYVLAQVGDSTPIMAVQSMAQSGPEPIANRLQTPDRRSPEYQRIIQELRQRHQNARGELENIDLDELGDIIFEAQRSGRTPRIVTGDSHVLRTLLGLEAGAATIAGDAEPETHQVQFLDNINLEIRAVPSPTSDYPFTTQIGDLAASLGRPLEFGQAIKIAKPDGTLVDAFLYGYGPTGLARVLLRELDGSPANVIYNVAENETISVANDFPSLGNYEDGASVTNDWHPREYRLADVENAPQPADGTPERLVHDNILRLRELKRRQVAGSTKTAEEFTNTMRDKNFRSWIVGGATRDILKGLDPADIDFATTMPAIDSYNAIVDAGLARKKPRQNDPEDLAIRRNVPFGTVQVEADMETGLDIISTHDGHDSSLRLDLDALARDFTINAVYYDFDNEVVVDPTGQGLADLAGNQLRFVAGTARDVLSAEPVMVARWMRMIGKGYTPADPADRHAALEWLVRHARPQAQGGMEGPVRQRFVDRIKSTKVKAEGLARRVFGDLQADQLDGQLWAELQQISGTDTPADAATWAIREIFR